MKLDSRQYEPPEYEHPVDDINWTKGVGQPAGVYWLEGRSVIVTHESAAEQRVLAAGGVLVATLRFDADPLEATHRGRSVERVNPVRVSSELLVSGVN